MTAEITPTEVSYYDIPCTCNYGTSSRRVVIALRLTTTTIGDTCDLATYIPNLADIEGISVNTESNGVSGTANTWATTVITFPGDIGAQELHIVGTIT